MKALPSDPASRLAISVSGQDANGNFRVWLVTRTGEKVVKKMNSLVDILDGYTYEERRKVPTRWFVEKPLGGGPKVVIYT